MISVACPGARRVAEINDSAAFRGTWTLNEDESLQSRKAAAAFGATFVHELIQNKEEENSTFQADVKNCFKEYLGRFLAICERILVAFGRYISLKSKNEKKGQS